jgi:hypothetical protein
VSLSLWSIISLNPLHLLTVSHREKINTLYLLLNTYKCSDKQDLHKYLSSVQVFPHQSLFVLQDVKGIWIAAILEEANIPRDKVSEPTEPT